LNYRLTLADFFAEFISLQPNSECFMLITAAVDVTPAVLITPHIGLSSTKDTVDVTDVVLLLFVTILTIAVLAITIIVYLLWHRSNRFVLPHFVYWSVKPGIH